MRIRPYIQAAFARDWEFVEVDHYPLLENLNNTLGQFPASFGRDSEKYVILNEMLVRKDPGVPVFLDEYMDLTVNGLMLEQQDTNLLLQTENMRLSPWESRQASTSVTQITTPGFSPSEEHSAYRFNMASPGLAWWEAAWGQILPLGVDGISVQSAFVREGTLGKRVILGNYVVNTSGNWNSGVYVPLPTGNLSSKGPTYPSTPGISWNDFQCGEWRHVEVRKIVSSTRGAFDPHHGIGGQWDHGLRHAYVFCITIQDRFYSSKIFSTDVRGIREPDILTVKSPQGLKQNKISFDFQYMPQGHSQEYEAVNINDGEISVYIREISTSVPNPVENEPNIIIKKSRLRVIIRGEGNTTYNFPDFVTPDVKDATYSVEILSTRDNNIRVKIKVNDEEHEADGILRGDVLLAEDMTISGWCVLSNLKVYEGY